eukprot:CAMPEP_0170747584 /NCGR_PEP_ID=MMETSP0437-20130122/9397_1 /TAXON_ID=0 /ORGANISM="Sexangularia sp." /LENGTH=87 /DNA_ID=CAMNT_0011086365 /DNA_START=309 /DNA_END=569 /DNA_ORIENTATION=-
MSLELLVLGGNSKPDADAIKAVLGAAGVEADDEKIDLLISEMKGKKLEEVIAAGTAKMSSVPAAPAAGAAAPAAAGGAAKEEKKAEP